MPNTSDEWIFWAFSTILLGFLLNVAAGLAADPIARKFARKRSKKTAAASIIRGQAVRSGSTWRTPNPSDPTASSFFVSGHTDNDLSREIDELLLETLLDQEIQATPLMGDLKSQSRDFDFEFASYSSYLTRERVIEPTRTPWLITMVLFAISLAISWLAATIGAPPIVPITALFIATILGVVAVALLVKYIRQRARTVRL